MVVWLKPCESRSSPGALPQIPVPLGRGFFIARGKNQHDARRRWKAGARPAATCHPGAARRTLTPTPLPAGEGLGSSTASWASVVDKRQPSLRASACQGLLHGRTDSASKVDRACRRSCDWSLDALRALLGARFSSTADPLTCNLPMNAGQPVHMSPSSALAFSRTCAPVRTQSGVLTTRIAPFHVAMRAFHAPPLRLFHLRRPRRHRLLYMRTALRPLSPTTRPSP
ncbi:hypothetical protein NB689_000871 [Xanthomonas sacchari]|nr:hypothetical protein [Xanthomonas sacchari]MCW0415117.1 hypothetical protein [Xanthomonas sacchari]